MKLQGRSGWKFDPKLRKPKRAVFLFAALLIFLPLSRLSAESPAAESPAALPPAAGAGMPAEELEKILEQDLGGLRKTRSIRFKEDNSEWEFPSFIRNIPWINFFQEAGAQALRVFLILLFAALALAAVIHSRRSGRPLLFNRPSSVSLPSPPEPLSPAALLAEADRLYRGGFLREAWGLCYAASLEALRLRWALRFPPGATEYRCLALVRLWAGRGPGAADCGRAEAAFAGLIRHWTALFYGGITPPAGAFEEAAAWVGSLSESPAPENKPAFDGGARG